MTAQLRPARDTVALAALVLPRPQTIDSFTASSTSIYAGTSITLTWTTSNASAVRLDGSTVAIDGSASVSPSVTHTYVLEADGSVATISSSIEITVQSPPSYTGNWLERRSAPGVFRWVDLGDAQASWYQAGTPIGIDSGETTPTVDTVVKTPGTVGSLRFDIPSLSSANAAGDIRISFSDDRSILMGGPGDALNYAAAINATTGKTTFYVQWRQRFNQAMVNTIFLQTGGGQQAGIKQADFSAGDKPGQVSPYGSCRGIELLVQSYYQARFPISYNECGTYALMQEWYGASDYRLQNAYAPTYCDYDQVAHQGNTSGCFMWVADEWFTFQVCIELGARTHASTQRPQSQPGTFVGTANRFSDSRYRLWGARENQPSQLLIDWTPSTPGGYALAAGDDFDVPGVQDDQYFGKLWLTPYMTSKDATQVHDLAQTWYAEVIMSTQPIADPASTTFPAWRQGKAVGTVYSITGPPTTAYMSGLHLKTPGANDSSMVDAWIGFAADEGKWWSALATGHATTNGFDWQNPVLMIDFAADAPAWTTYEAGSDYSSVNLLERYTDGRPASRHTYYTVQHIPAGVMADGLERVFSFTCWAAYATSLTGSPKYVGGPEVAGFKVAAGVWEPAGTYSDFPGWAPANPNVPAVCKHPTTHDVYVGANSTLYRWNAAANPPTWTLMAQYPDLLSWNNGAAGYASLIDVARNRIVCLHDGQPYSSPGTIRLQCVALTSPYAVSNHNLQGVLTTGSISQVGFCHDTDGDRYIVVSGTTLYAIDPDTHVSSAIGTVNSVAGGNAPLARLAYLPDQGCIVYLASYASPIQFMPTR